MKYLVTEDEFKSATVNEAGELEFTRDNGEKVNAGRVKGDPGEPGPAGPNTVPTYEAIGAALTEDGPVKDQLNATFASYPPREWEQHEGESIVTHRQFPYGDVRRYGCPCNGVDDDSARLQLVFDVCGLVAVPIIKPALPMRIENPVILRSRSTHNYIFVGNENKTSGNIIFCTADYCFVGEDFYAATPMFTDVVLNMEKIVVACTLQKDVVVFKAITLYNCVLYRNKFYNPYVLIEGSMRVWTRFDENRVQGFRRAFIASSSTLPGVTRDDAAAAYVAASYDTSVLATLLVRASSGTTVNAYINKSNDGYVKNNYISGAQTNTVLASVLEVDDIDADLFFYENWIEFCEYVTRPHLRTNTVATSTRIYGTTFTNNVFQYFFRLFDENTNYSSWVFEHNDMTSFSRTGLESIFTNAESPKFATKKCGMLVADRVEGDNATFTDIILTDNRWYTSDYGIYLDEGTASKYHRVKERGTKLLSGATGVTNPIYVRLRATAANTSAFMGSFYELLQNKNYTTLPTLSDATNYYLNVFNGQMATVAGTPYLTMLGADGLPKYQALA